MSTLLGDIELWAACKEGDRNAFGTLFRRHYSLLYNYGLKINTEPAEVEDCIQELFVDLWRTAPTTNIDSVKAYLLTALKYKLFRLKRKKEAPIAAGDDAFEINQGNFMEAREDASMQTAKIISALNQLPPRQKEIVYLKIFHNLSYEELESIMGVNYQVCRNLFSQAIKGLRKIIVEK